MYATHILVLSFAINGPLPSENRPIENTDSAAEQGENEISAPAEEVETLEPADLQVADELYSEAYAHNERIFNVLTARPLKPYTWMSTINHRSGTGLRDRPGYNWAGFAGGGLNVGLGLRYGVLNGLDVGILLVNHAIEPFNTYEYDARYQVLHQERHAMNAAVRLGGSLFHQQDASVANAWFGQVIVDRIWADRVITSINSAFHSNSSNPRKATDDPLATLSVGLGVEARCAEALALDAEITIPVAGYHVSLPGFSMGPKLITNRHTFSLLLANTQALSLDSTVTGGSSKSLGDFVLGFVITRQIDP